MVTYRFIENEPNLVKEFFENHLNKKHKLYLIAVGAFENDKLAEVFTVGKPPKDFSYTFALKNCITDKYLEGMLRHFHIMYDGLIEGLD